MDSREQILKTIGKNIPALLDLPTIDIDAVISYPDLVEQYRETLAKIGGFLELPESEEAFQDLINNATEKKDFVINTLTLSAEEKQKVQAMDSYTLESLDVAVVKGKVAVAENSCIWVEEQEMVNRLIPFITQHLILVVEKEHLLPTMHHAYEQIHVAGAGFGAFIAGPSKTADIEQSLVIGAHGARSLTVIMK